MKNLNYFNIGDRLAKQYLKIEIEGKYFYNENVNETEYMIIKNHEINEINEIIETLKEYYDSKGFYITDLIMIIEFKNSKSVYDFNFLL